MLKNNMYNLIEQLTEESKSLWRIKNNYKSDSGSHEKINEFWTKLEADKELHIQELQQLIKREMNNQ